MLPDAAPSAPAPDANGVPPLSFRKPQPIVVPSAGVDEVLPAIDFELGMAGTDARQGNLEYTMYCKFASDIQKTARRAHGHALYDELYQSIGAKKRPDAS